MSFSVLKDENLQGREKNNFHNILCDEFFQRNITYCKLIYYITMTSIM